MAYRQQSKTGGGAGGQEPWRNKERHYCAVCNSWMGSDRSSILLHENGRKHQEKLVEQLQEKRKAKAAQESQAKSLQASLSSMEAAARSALANDLGYFVDTTAVMHSFPAAVQSSTPNVPPPPPPPPQPQQQPSKQPPMSSKKEWESRKRQRQEEKKRKRNDGDGANSDGASDDERQQSSFHNRQSQRKIGLDEGHYTVVKDNSGTITYLEGTVFGKLLEPDMPVELWRGSPMATAPEQRLPSSASHWIPAIIVRRRRRRPPPQQRPQSTGGFVPENDNDVEQQQDVVDVAYLASADATDETVEESVPLFRIRIRLGGDELLPETIVEARLMAGIDAEEEEVVTAHNQQLPEETIDEATGLSAWTTVKIKRTTIRKELQEERARLREQRKQAALEEARQKKLAETRRMEEAAVANAEDSALGAFDIWNRGTKEGYKGVYIHEEPLQQQQQPELGALAVEGKKLSDGKTVEFKKKSIAFKAQKKKQNQRRTSADD